MRAVREWNVRCAGHIIIRWCHVRVDVDIDPYRVHTIQQPPVVVDTIYRRRGQAPALRGGTNRFYPYGVVHSGGGTRWSRPTRSGRINRSCDFRCIPTARCSMVRCAGRRPRAVSLGPLVQFTFCRHRPLQGAMQHTNPIDRMGYIPAAEPIGFIHMGWCIPAAGHAGPALRDHTEPGSGGAEGPLALSPQQCEAWIECVTALFPTHCTKSNK